MTKTMTVRTGVKAGGLPINHGEAVAVRTSVKAGGLPINHCEA
jgi:hypothetical protein